MLHRLSQTGSGKIYQNNWADVLIPSIIAHNIQEHLNKLNCMVLKRSKPQKLVTREIILWNQLFQGFYVLSSFPVWYFKQMGRHCWCETQSCNCRSIYRYLYGSFQKKKKKKVCHKTAKCARYRWCVETQIAERRKFVCPMSRNSCAFADVRVSAESHSHWKQNRPTAVWVVELLEMTVSLWNAWLVTAVCSTKKDWPVVAMNGKMVPVHLWSLDRQSGQFKSHCRRRLHCHRRPLRPPNLLEYSIAWPQCLKSALVSCLVTHNFNFTLEKKKSVGFSEWQPRLSTWCQILEGSEFVVWSVFLSEKNMEQVDNDNFSTTTGDRKSGKLPVHSPTCEAPAKLQTGVFECTCLWSFSSDDILYAGGLAKDSSDPWAKKLEFLNCNLSKYQQSHRAFGSFASGIWWLEKEIRVGQGICAVTRSCRSARSQSQQRRKRKQSALHKICNCSEFPSGASQRQRLCHGQESLHNWSWRKCGVEWVSILRRFYLCFWNGVQNLTCVVASAETGDKQSVTDLTIPCLGAEDVVDEAVSLLAKLEDDRVETKNQLESEKERVQMLSSKIDALADQRLKALPLAVQKGTLLNVERNVAPRINYSWNLETRTKLQQLKVVILWKFIVFWSHRVSDFFQVPYLSEKNSLDVLNLLHTFLQNTKRVWQTSVNWDGTFPTGVAWKVGYRVKRKRQNRWTPFWRKIFLTLENIGKLAFFTNTLKFVVHLSSPQLLRLYYWWQRTTKARRPHEICLQGW